MDIFDCFDKLEELTRGGDWTALEAEFRRIAAEMADSDVAGRIAGIDLAAFQTSLREQLAAAVAASKSGPTEAILYRYELASGWPGRFFLCPNYEPFEGDEEWWAAEAQQVGEAVEQNELGDIYLERGAEGDDSGAAVMLQLVARTIASLGRQLDALDDAPLAVCMAYTGQEPFSRIREYHRPKSMEMPAVELGPGDTLPGLAADPTGDLGLGDLPDTI